MKFISLASLENKMGRSGYTGPHSYRSQEVGAGQGSPLRVTHSRCSALHPRLCSAR